MAQQKHGTELVKAISPVAEDDLHWSKVLASSKEKLIVIDIHQDWCGPCETLQPTMHRIALDTTDCANRCGFCSASMGKLKAQVGELLSADARAALEKRGCMPFFALVKGGAVVATVTGADAPLLLSLVKAHMPHKKSTPTVAECQRALGMLPETAIMREFRWTQDFAEARKMSIAFAMTLQEVAAKGDYSAKPLVGVLAWLERLQVAGVPCAAVSRFPSVVVDRALQESGLTPYVSAQVSAEDDFERDLQGFLKATLKINRPPSKCAVFDCRPAGMIQAHEADFKGVATVGLHPVYELGVADLLTPSLADLHVQNVRRLFSDRSYESELQLQPELEPERKRRPLATRYEDPPQTETESSSENWSSRSRRARRR